MQNYRPCLCASFATMILFMSLALPIHAAGAETVLHAFTGPDGANPRSSLISDGAGNLYGTTFAGGASTLGTVFELLAANNYQETILYSFTGGSDGGSPAAGVIMDGAGNLYGTTTCGGIAGCASGGSSGVVFELVKASGFSEAVLYRFTGGSDGGQPFAPLVMDLAGNLYGTTTCGGLSNSCSGPNGGDGVVFELVKARGYSETVLYRFTGGSDGGKPFAPVILDASGNLYGTTEFGGTGTCAGSGCGVVFELVKARGFAETDLHRFTGGSDGGMPVAPVVFDSSGDLFGTAMCGGLSVCAVGAVSNGVVFEFAPSTGLYKVLRRFHGTDGAQPTSGLIFANNGTAIYAYGATFAGGAHGLGVAFRMLPTGSSYTVLHAFAGGTDGAHPFFSTLDISPGSFTFDPLHLPRIRCPSHCAYGTTVTGGTANVGTAFQISPI
jgi:uncharacterized repeat protein (TIGR03803 family)